MNVATRPVGILQLVCPMCENLEFKRIDCDYCCGEGFVPGPKLYAVETMPQIAQDLRTARTNNWLREFGWWLVMAGVWTAIVAGVLYAGQIWQWLERLP